jgi:CheY-like chemotaxis protein
MIHELGVSFAEPIDARDFAGADPLCNTYSLERVEPSELSGTVTLISPAQSDRLMLKHYVRESSLRATAFDSVAEAQASLGESDVVLMCTTMPGTTPKQDLGAIRDSGYAGPVILLVPDRLPPTRAAMLALSADAFIVRPLQQEVLLMALAEVLLLRTTAAKSRGSSQSLSAGPWLAEGLADLADSIQQAMRRASASETRGFVAKLHSLAMSTGLQSIAALCGAIDECLASPGGLAEAEDGLAKLLTTCETTAREMGGRRSAA